MAKKYRDNFCDSNFDVNPFIEKWPDSFNKDIILKWVNLKNASMIFVPVYKDPEDLTKSIISKEYFYCSLCKQWKKTFSSVKNIKRHVSIHVPQTDQTKEKKILTNLLTQEQESRLVKNLVGFILIDVGSFNSIECIFLENFSDMIPKREQIVIALENISKDTQNEITQLLMLSSANSITFDEWNDKRNRKYLGITMRALIDGNYMDFFLDLVRLNYETNNSQVLADAIKKSLLNYKLNVDEIISCTTDNCALMVRTAEILDLWRIPCVCHLLNLIFQEFIISSKQMIEPIFDLINKLTESEKYQNFIERKKMQGVNVKKIPKYVSNRWTSFCDSLIVLYETKFFIKEFLGNSILNSRQEGYLRLLQNFCQMYKCTIQTYESDQFGAIGYFLADISIIIQSLTELEETDFKNAVINTKKKIEELQNTHYYFWNNISCCAVLLNPQIEDYELLLTKEKIKSAKRTIKLRMQKYSKPSIEKKDLNDTINSPRIERFQKKEIIMMAKV